MSCIGTPAALSRAAARRKAFLSTATTNTESTCGGVGCTAVNAPIWFQIEMKLPAVVARKEFSVFVGATASERRAAYPSSTAPFGLIA
eukprot:6217966-Prymnesium_polylepis.1